MDINERLAKVETYLGNYLKRTPNWAEMAQQFQQDLLMGYIFIKEILRYEENHGREDLFYEVRQNLNQHVPNLTRNMLKTLISDDGYGIAFTYNMETDKSWWILPDKKSIH